MSGTPLPNASPAVVPTAKLRHYLLDASHPGNGGKAAFFGAFGFTLRSWQTLRDVLLEHPGMPCHCRDGQCVGDEI